jgi:predicted ATP-grasp superfamily ATP-dependent carboligase
MRMRIFIYEYTCSVESQSIALRSEGWAMLKALLEDFELLAAVETLTLADHRHGDGRPVRAGEEEVRFRELAAAADYTLLIAPEFDAILATRCRWVIESGGRLLGPDLAAVELTGDKLRLSNHLRARGVPTPQSRLFVPEEEVPGALFPLVWKPRYGAGSQATFLVNNPQQLRRCPDQARLEGWQGEALLQPFVPGRAASVAFLTGPRCRMPLLPSAQHLTEDGRFHYRGGATPLAGGLAVRATAIAQRAIDSVPELHGYVGVDVVLGHAEDGSGDAVIEINPRPTTSYVGLRTMATGNLAEALLQVTVGDQIPRLAWQSGTVRFDADGAVQWSP